MFIETFFGQFSWFSHQFHSVKCLCIVLKVMHTGWFLFCKCIIMNALYIMCQTVYLWKPLDSHISQYDIEGVYPIPAHFSTMKRCDRWSPGVETNYQCTWRYLCNLQPIWKPISTYIRQTISSVNKGYGSQLQHGNSGSVYQIHGLRLITKWLVSLKMTPKWNIFNNLQCISGKWYLYNL